MGAAPGYDDLVFHIRVFGEEHVIRARMRVGPTKVLDLLPLAREISEGVAAIAVGRAVAGGERISCRAGCGVCCAQLVPIAPAEALRLAEVVDAMPRPRRRAVATRFDDAVRRLKEAGLVDPRSPPGVAALRSSAPAGADRWKDVSRRYFDSGIPCPFLEDGSCGIYPERPMVCREYFVTTPASLCATLSPYAAIVPRLLRMNEVMTAFTNGVFGRDDHQIPLVLLREWARANRAAFAREGDGEELAMDLIRRIREFDDADNG